MTIKEKRRKHNQYIAENCQELQNFQNNAIRQLERNILHELKEQFGPGVSYEWDIGCCGNPLRVLDGFAADIVVEVPTNTQPHSHKTYNGFVWLVMDGSIHMELEFHEEIRF